MSEVYSWVPWFKDLAEKIAERGPEYLNTCTNRMAKMGSRELLQYELENIDPFSFFYFLSQKLKTSQHESVYSSAIEVFDLNKPLPLSVLDEIFFASEQSSNAEKLLLSDSTQELSSKKFQDRLWIFFRKSISTNPKNIKNQEFSNILKMPGLDVRKITQCLFLMKPDTFILIDDTLPKSLEGLRDNIQREGGWVNYLDIIDKLKMYFLGYNIYEIPRHLYRISSIIPDKKPSYYSITTRSRDNGNLWKNFSENGIAKIQYFKKNPELMNAARRASTGDIILARYGKTKALGIGIVEKNDYAKSVSENKEDSLHVVWINKQEVKYKLSEKSLGTFIIDGPESTGSYNSFRQIGEYQPTFEMIDSFAIHEEIRDEHRIENLSTYEEKILGIPSNQFLSVNS